MHARAVLAVERDPSGRTVVRTLRSRPPLTLLPRRDTCPTVTVHLVGSAASSLGGDDVGLEVWVGAGAQLVLTGVAATLALPGPGATSRLDVRLELGQQASAQYLPEPTVVTARADHRGTLRAELAAGARLRYREVLVAGRTGEPAGRFRGTTRVVADGRPLLAQTHELGDATLQDSPAYLAGHRVLATEVLVWDDDPVSAVTGEWWALTPLRGRGSLATAIGADAVTARRALASAVAAHPGWTHSSAGGQSAPR